MYHTIHCLHDSIQRRKYVPRKALKLESCFTRRSIGHSLRPFKTCITRCSRSRKSCTHWHCPVQVGLRRPKYLSTSVLQEVALVLCMGNKTFVPTFSMSLALNYDILTLILTFHLSSYPNFEFCRHWIRVLLRNSDRHVWRRVAGFATVSTISCKHRV